MADWRDVSVWQRLDAEGGGARQVFGMKPTDRLAIQDVIVGVVDAVTER